MNVRIGLNVSGEFVDEVLNNGKLIETKRCGVSLISRREWSEWRTYEYKDKVYIISLKCYGSYDGIQSMYCDYFHEAFWKYPPHEEENKKEEPKNIYSVYDGVEDIDLGYFTSYDDAHILACLRNAQSNNRYRFHVHEIPCLDGMEEIKNANLKYETLVEYEFGEIGWHIVSEYESDIYISDNFRSNSIFHHDNTIGIRVNTSSNNRNDINDLADVVLTEFIKFFNASFIYPGDIDNDDINRFNTYLKRDEEMRKKREEQERIEREERAELARLKAKYEQQ